MTVYQFEQCGGFWPELREINEHAIWKQAAEGERLVLAPRDQVDGALEKE